MLQGGDVDLVGAGDVDLHAVLEGGTKQVGITGQNSGRAGCGRGEAPVVPPLGALVGIPLTRAAHPGD